LGYLGGMDAFQYVTEYHSDFIFEIKCEIEVINLTYDSKLKRVRGFY
jgi:hypothetical protein